jgi:opacity protein-like surface antigen
MTCRRYVLVAAAVVTAILAAAPAAAQSRFQPYAGASIGSFSVSADEVDGRSVAGGLFGGMSLGTYVDLDVEVVLPADTFTRSYTGPSVSFAAPGSSYDETVRRSVITRFDKEREVIATFSAVVILRPATGQRVTPGLVVGVTNHRVRDRTVYTPVSIPDGVDPQHPSVVGSIETHSRNIGGPTIGANLAIALTRQLSIVPDVRYDYGSIGDEINNSLRTSVRMQWSF